MKNTGSKIKWSLIFFVLLFAEGLIAQSFQMLIGAESSGEDHSIENVVGLSDGGTLAILRDGPERSCIKVDETGEPLWHKHYELNTAVGNLIATNDGGAYLIRRSDIMNDYEHIINIIRLDASGAILWSKRYTIPTPDYSFLMYYRGVIRSNNGLDLLVTANHYSLTHNYIMRLEPDGEISWVNTTEEVIYNDDFYPSLLHDNNDGVITLFNEGDGAPGRLTRMDQAGNTLFSVRARMTNTSWIYMLPSLAYDGGDNIYVFAEQHGNGMAYSCLLKFNTTGQLLWYRLTQMNIIPSIENHVGNVMGDGSIVFGDNVRMTFDPSGNLMSVEEMYKPLLINGSFIYRELGIPDMLPNGDLVSGGSWRKEDTTFAFVWRTPLLSRLPWDHIQVCNRELNEYMWSDTLVPIAYTEVVDRPDWVPHTAEVTENPITVIDLELPIVTPFCAEIPTSISEVNASPLHVAPSLLSANEICNVQLDRQGRVELYDASGRTLHTDGGVREVHSITTIGLASGCYLIRAIDTKGSLIGTARIMIH